MHEAAQDYRLALASLGPHAGTLVGTGAFGDRLAAAFPVLGNVREAADSVRDLMPAVRTARDALQRVRGSFAALVPAAAAPAATPFEPAAASGPLAQCPDRSCVVYELRALNDASGQPVRTAQVPDRTPIEVIGDTTGVITLEGAEPRRWSHVRLRATDGSTIEGWMKPENLNGAPPSTAKLVPTSTGQLSPFGASTPPTPMGPDEFCGRVFPESKLPNPGFPGFFPVASFPTVFPRRAVITAPILRERASQARAMGQPWAIVRALENQAQSAPASASNLQPGQVVRVDMRVVGGIRPVGQDYVNVQVISTSGECRPDLYTPGIPGSPVPVGFSAPLPGGGEFYRSETVADPVLLQAIAAKEAEVAAWTNQLPALRAQLPPWQMQMFEQQLLRAQAELRALYLRHDPIPAEMFR